MKIRIAICDDSDHDRHYLKSIIKNYFKGREIEPEIVEYGSGEEFFRKPDVEILFLEQRFMTLGGIHSYISVLRLILLSLILHLLRRLCYLMVKRL